MKKIILFVLIPLIFSGCSALNRINPTDPKSGNYEGLHYTGSIGTFTVLSDIKAQDSTSVWATDSGANKIFKYEKNGDQDYALFGGNIIAPSGICADTNYFYVVDKDTNYHNLKRFNPLNVTDTTISQPPLYAAIALNKCAEFAQEIYLTDNNTVYVFSTSANAMTGVSWVVSPNANISDIKTDSAGNVIVADSASNDIFVYSPAGAIISEFQYSFSISGFALSGNYLYIPGFNGLHKINYPSLTEAQVLANYGQGNGKVNMPGPCDAFSDGTILVGTGTSIKVFVP